MTRTAAILLLLTAGVATAAPPPGTNTDSAIGRWVHTAKDWRGIGCCDLSDCRQTAIRLNANDKYEAWIGREEYGPHAPDAWMPVSAEAMAATADGPPPDGRAWACFYGGRVMCFFTDGAT